jgi:uncharacterized membrane protein (DUF485 family)
VTLLFRALLVFGILVVIAAGLVLTLMEVRRGRRELERHVALVIGNDRAVSLRAAEEQQQRTAQHRRAAFEQRVRGFFTPGTDHNWGMQAGIGKLAIAAVIAALMAWMALSAGLHVSAHLA